MLTSAKSIFPNLTFPEATYLNTNLSEANLSQARNYLIDPGLNELKKTKFSLPEAMSLLYNMDIILTDGEIET